MIALLRVCDAAAGKKHPPQEGRPAALLLQQSEVDVQGQVLLRAEAQQVHDPAELAACTADVRRSYDYAKWLQLTSKVEHSHSQNYAAYSH